MKGTIEQIYENKDKRGEKYWVLTINGQRYSVWDQKLVENLSQGDIVSFLWKQQGRYKNITELKRLEDLQERRHLEIVRMSCIRSAAELVSGTRNSPEKKAELVIRVARQFESHITAKEEAI